MRQQAALLLLGITALTVVIFILFPDLDLTVARALLMSDGQTIKALVAPFGVIHRWVPLAIAACLTFFCVAAAAEVLGRRILGLTRWHALYVVAVFIIGPGLLANSVLKDHSGRPRPGAVLEFGGSMVYEPPFDFDGICNNNCSFVAGDAAAAFAFLAPALLLPRRYRSRGIAAALVLGVATGLMRMLQGAHFLSDVIFAGLVVTSTAFALHWAMFRPDGQLRHASAAGRNLVPAGAPPTAELGVLGAGGPQGNSIMEPLDIFASVFPTKRIRMVQVGIISIVLLSFFLRPHWNEATARHEILEQVGLLLVFVCILGRLWSFLYIDANKDADLITTGPFSMTRNPLSFYSTLGMFGVGLIFGSFTVALLFGGVFYAIFRVTGAKEAAVMKSRYGTAYEEYAGRTPLFWPNLFAYRDVEQLSFSTTALRVALLDAVWLWAAFPIIEMLEFAHITHRLPTLFTLY